MVETPPINYTQLQRDYVAHTYKLFDDIVESYSEGVWVWDIEGKKYLDMLAGYSALNQGHRHPKIINAGHKQLDRLTLSTGSFPNDQTPLFAKALAEITGKDKVLFGNSGAEAVEKAIKGARKWGETVKGIGKDKTEIIGCAGNFHGRTLGALSLSTEEQYRFGFGPFPPGSVRIPYGDIEALKTTITPNTAGFFVEPIQAEGGVHVPPKGYLKEAYEICKANNVLFAADEIQTGLGRTGKMFGCDHDGVVPDIYVIGKAISGGILSISVIAANDAIMQVFDEGSDGSTFGGNPLAAAIGRAALEVTQEEKLPENAQVMGEYLMDQLKSLKSPLIKEIRGKGLLIGLELTPKAGHARPLCEKLLREGIITKETHNTVIRLTPPLTIKQEEIDWAMERIGRVLT